MTIEKTFTTLDLLVKVLALTSERYLSIALSQL